jgi:uncharacterized peroxidase-related enzyme
MTLRDDTQLHVEGSRAMDRQQARLLRADQEPIVGGLPDVPGIGVAMRLTPGLGLHLRGLADELLVNPFPGASLTRAERELIAMSVSAGNDCYFCMDSHGAFATVLLRDGGEASPEALVEQLKSGAHDALDERMRALLAIAEIVRRDPLLLTAEDVQRAIDAGACDADVQLAVLIASAFSMYNRMVDGLRARTPGSIDAFLARATEIARQGYSAPSAPSPSGSSSAAATGAARS